MTRDELRVKVLAEVRKTGAGDYGAQIATDAILALIPDWRPIAEAGVRGEHNTHVQLAWFASGAWGLCENEGAPFYGWGGAPRGFNPTHYLRPTPPEPTHDH